jgi:hypothetical protein
MSFDELSSPALIFRFPRLILFKLRLSILIAASKLGVPPSPERVASPFSVPFNVIPFGLVRELNVVSLKVLKPMSNLSSGFFEIIPSIKHAFQPCEMDHQLMAFEEINALTPQP